VTDRCVYLTDLDDTLFRSLRKHPGTDGLSRVTTANNGHHGHMSAAQRAFFAALRETGEVIPVTARGSDAFARVHLDFGTSRAILANGAVILDEAGRADPDWLSRTSRIGREAGPSLDAMRAFIGAELGEGFRSWIVEEYGTPVYFCVKMDATGETAVQDGLLALRERLVARFDLSGMWSHANGNNLSFTPIGISKRDACLHLIDRLGSGVPLVGIGDSLTDLPFMSLCDFIVTPSGSQIADRMRAGASAGASR